MQAANNAFDLSWSTVSGAAGYQLIVWSGSGNWQLLGGGDLTGNNYSHTGLAEDSTYHYAIRAVTATEAEPLVRAGLRNRDRLAVRQLQRLRQPRHSHSA